MFWNGIILMPICIQMLLSNPMPIQIDQDQAYHFCVYPDLKRPPFSSDEMVYPFVRHRPGPEWGAWGNPQELNWFLLLIKPLRRTCTLCDPGERRYEANQVWLNTTFISQGSQSQGKLAVETWRVKTELIIIIILHITITTTSILNLRFKTIAPKILAHTKMLK